MDVSIRFIFSEFAIDFSSLADIDNPNRQLIILNGIDNAVANLPDPKSILINALTFSVEMLQRQLIQNQKEWAKKVLCYVKIKLRMERRVIHYPISSFIKLI